MQFEQLKRRAFITLIGGAAAWPLAARAQQPAMPTVGFVRITTPQDSAHLVAAFRHGLAEIGYVEGQNVTIEYRYALNQVERLPAIMADLVGRRVSVLAATGGTISARAAKAATATIPIVFTTGDDPVRVGLVASLSRPDGNATGVSVFTARLGAKRLGLLHEMVPTASPIAVLVNPTNPDTEDEANDIRGAASGLGIQIVVARAGKANDLDDAFAMLVQRGARALIIGLELLRTRQADAMASARPLLLLYSDQMGGSRVLEDRYGALILAMAVRKEQPGLLAYISEFVEEAKAAGLVKRAVEHAGVRGVEVAPLREVTR